MWAPAAEGRPRPLSHRRRAGLPGRGRQLCDARPVFARLDGSVPLPAFAPLQSSSCLALKSPAPGVVGLCGCRLRELKRGGASGCEGGKKKILLSSEHAQKKTRVKKPIGVGF